MPIDANLADCLDLAAGLRGDNDALVQGHRRLRWTDLRRRAHNLGRAMLEAGVSRQGKVALYTWNHPAYMEGCYAAMAAGLVPFNVNYRYREEELHYLLDNADTELVVVHEEFVPRLEHVVADLPKVRGFLVAGDGPAPNCGNLRGARSYEEAAEADGPPLTAARSPDDQLFLYTGGTTGMPKGVMWRQGDLYFRLAGGGVTAPPASPEDLRAFIAEQRVPLRTLIGPPLMHGTGWFTALIAWLAGGCVVLLEDPHHFSPRLLWETIERERPTALTIVGDSFARPMLRELRDGGRSYDLGSLRLISSSGVIWSEEAKQGLLDHMPEATLIDSFSSSEAIGMGASITSAKGVVRTGKFQLGERTRLFDENLQPLETAPGVKGLVGVGGMQPLGYYKDPDKTARTFVQAEGRRYSIPGDWAQVNDDGKTLTLLGRGSVCINTGGEKVFPEEVEEVVKKFPGVHDSVVVGIPDEKWGEAITAVVSTFVPVDEAALVAFVKEHLAGYKAPKHIVFVDQVFRSPSGKADYKHTKQVALDTLGLAI
jgi:fatty-acyl-CoA synthase